MGLLYPESYPPQFLITCHKQLRHFGAAISRGPSLGFGAEYLLCAGLLIVRHSWRVTDPLTAAHAATLDQAVYADFGMPQSVIHEVGSLFSSGLAAIFRTFT